MIVILLIVCFLEHLFYRKYAFALFFLDQFCARKLFIPDILSEGFCINCH
jgi:hypothetical protein